MAERKESEDEFNPRHRIVGAVILVALAVIFLPMVLDDEPPQTGPAAVVETPVADSRVTGVRPADQTAPAATDRDVPVAPARSTRIVTVPVEPVATTPRPERPVHAPAPTPAPVPTPSPPPVARIEPTPLPVASTSKKPAVAAPSTAVAGGWVVQVGVFSQADNARRLQERLKAKGYAVTLDPPAAPTGKAVRVEVGPYKDQTAAKSAAARIQRDFAIQGIVRSR